MATTQTPNPTTPKATNAKPQAAGAAPPPKTGPKATTKAAPGAIARNETAQEAATEVTFGQRLMRTLRGSKVNASAPATGANKPAANGANATSDTTGRRGALGTPPGYWRKFFQGSLIFVGGSYIIILALTYVSLHFPALGLNATIQPPKANVLVLSGLSWENLIFLIVIIGLWLLVQKLGLMPRPEPMAQNSARGSSGASSAGGAKSGTNKKAADELPGIGEHRTRAERRRLANIAAEKEAQKAAVRAKTKGGEKAAATPTPTATSAKNGKTTTAKTPTAAVASPKALSGDHDEAYERVKADQRLRRRREARR